MDDAAPAGVYEPGGQEAAIQVAGVEAPVVAENFPELQSVGVAVPGPPHHAPAGHVLHSAAFGGAHCPTEQLVGESEPPPHEDPAGHGSQELPTA